MDTAAVQLLTTILYVVSVVFLDATPQQGIMQIVQQMPEILGTQTKQEQQLNIPPDSTSSQVTKVVDGDTIHVLLGNTRYTIRLIGIDTPEVVDPRRPVQCYGQEASQRLKTLLVGKKVHLTDDTSQSDKDKYGRLLRYVWLDDGTNINEQMIREGYAYEYTYDVPYTYQQLFKEAQIDAQKRKIGLWSDTTCNGKK